MKFTTQSLVLVSSLILMFTLGGCSGDQPTAHSIAANNSKSLMPANPELAAIYQRSCKTCHATGAAKAPLTGDIAAWEPRMEQGMETMLDHAINGFGGMPPFGMCMDCEPEEFEALIQFMATGK